MLIDRRALLLSAAAAAAAPALASGGVAQGRIETLPRFTGGDAPNLRVRVWLPPRYPEAGRRYRTLYLPDGQHAFAGDSDGFNFSVDRRLARLAATGAVEPPVVVAIDNLEEDRFLQYMPQAIYDAADADVRAVVDREVKRVGERALISAPFIRFVTAELKPSIDKAYQVSPDRRDTAVFGASMAGLIAGALFVEGQQSFGRAACMSPNWPIYDSRMIDHPRLPALWGRYFSQLGGPAGRKLWLDHGTEMMDAGMGPHQAAIASALTRLGWRRGRDLQTKVYKAGHAFAQTATQMDEVLAWLLA